MFYAKQFKSLLDTVRQLDPDAEVVPSLLKITFKLPNIGTCVVQYKHQGFDETYNALGTITLQYADNMTEFDSLNYAIDGIEGLARQANDTQPETEANEFSTMDADNLSCDLVKYLYDKYPAANFIGEKEGMDGSIALRFDWGKADLKTIGFDLKNRYGDRIQFCKGRTQYAPEIQFDVIRVMPPKSAPVTESATGNVADDLVLIENFPVWAIEPTYNHSWGDHIQYYGEKAVTEDLKCLDNFMTANGFCGIQPVSEKERIKGHNDFCSHPAFGKPGDTEPVYAVKGPWKSLVQEFGLDKGQPVTESADNTSGEMTTDEVKNVIESLGLKIVNTWFDGNRSRPVYDCQTSDGKTICVWNEPPYEAKIWLKNANPRNNGLIENIVTLGDLQSKLASISGTQPTAPTSTESADWFELTDADDGGQNDFIIELDSKKGWSTDTADELVDVLNKNFNPDGKLKIFSMGSYSDDDGSIFQIYVDQSAMPQPVDRDAFRKSIQIGSDAIFNEADSDDADDNADAEQSLGDSIDMAMMDHYDMMNGDIGDIDFEAAITTLCNKANKPALAESVMKLYKIYKPVMEAENGHQIPQEIAIKANNIVAAECKWSDELRERELESTWDWLEEHSDVFIPAWKKTGNVNDGLQAIYNDEERRMTMAEIGMM